MAMKRVDFLLDEIKIKFLSSLSGTLSEHLRRAIDDYIEKKKALNVSASKSKKVGDLNG